MSTQKKKPEPKKKTNRQSRPASTPEGREKQLVKLAVDLAEKQLKEGSASPSIINHYLKIASSRETLEREILERQAKLIEAKADNMSKDREAQEVAQAAIEAMRNYQSGN